MVVTFECLTVCDIFIPLTHANFHLKFFSLELATDSLIIDKSLGKIVLSKVKIDPPQK